MDKYLEWQSQIIAEMHPNFRGWVGKMTEQDFLPSYDNFTRGAAIKT